MLTPWIRGRALRPAYPKTKATMRTPLLFLTSLVWLSVSPAFAAPTGPSGSAHLVTAAKHLPAARSHRLDHTKLLFYRTSGGTVVPVRTITDWRRRRAEFLRRMQEVMGPLPGPAKRCPLDMRIEEEHDCGSYLRRRISYASEPGSRVPAYRLIPKHAHRARGVLCLHPTDDRLGSKVVVGGGISLTENRPVNWPSLVVSRWPPLTPYPPTTNFSWKIDDRIVRAARPIFRLYEKSENLQVRHPDSEHDFPDAIRQEAYRFIQSRLPPRSGAGNSLGGLSSPLTQP